MKKLGIVLAALMAFSMLMSAAPKETKVKYGKNIYYSGEVDKDLPTGAGAIYLKSGKNASAEVVKGTFHGNIIDDGEARIRLTNGEFALLEGRFIFLAPADKDASSFVLILERGTIIVGDDSFSVPTNISFLVAPDEFLGISYRSNDTFYSCMRKKGSADLTYGPVRNAGSDYGARIEKVDSLRIKGDMYYPLEDGLWRKWISKTDYIDSRMNPDNSFTPVSIHRVNPYDQGAVDSDMPGSIYEDHIYTGTIKYPDNSSYEGTFRYRIIVDVRYLDGTFTGNDVVDTWKEGLNLTEIERARQRKIERIKKEISELVSQADTTVGTFAGRRYIAIKDADQISYQGVPAWIFHLDYIDFKSKASASLVAEKTLIYAVNADGGLGDILYTQDVPYASGDAASYIEKQGKIYIWKGDVPENYESFYEILSGYDIALRSDKNYGVRYFLNNDAEDTLAKEICKKIGVPYVSKADENLAIAESLNL